MGNESNTKEAKECTCFEILFGLLFHTWIVETVSSRVQSRDAIRITFGNLDQFKITAVVSADCFEVGRNMSLVRDAEFDASMYVVGKVTDFGVLSTIKAVIVTQRSNKPHLENIWLNGCGLAFVPRCRRTGDSRA